VDRPAPFPHRAPGHVRQSTRGVGGHRARALRAALAAMAILSLVLASGVAAVIPYGATATYSSQTGTSTYVAKPAYWCPPTEPKSLCTGTTVWTPGQTAYYAFDSTWWSPSNRADLRAKIDAEMAILNGANAGYEAGSWANVPHFYRAQQGDTATLQPGVTIRLWFTYSATGLSGAARRSPGKIQINTNQTAVWMQAIVAHEMGHNYGFWHSSMQWGPGQGLTIMSQGLFYTTMIRYGSCDMAGLQAKYGIGSGYNKLSTCLPKATLKGPSAARVNDTITLTATMSATTAFFLDFPNAYPYSRSVDFSGLLKDMHLFGIDANHNTKDLGTGTCGSQQCKWTIPSFGTHHTFYVGSTWVTAHFNDKDLTITLL
jgi:hypothetical protein